MRIVKKSKAIGILFIGLWVAGTLAYILQNELSYSLLIIPQRKNTALSRHYKSPSAPAVLSGNFIAEEDNLGLIFIQSRGTNSLKRSDFHFRLREVGKSVWLHESRQRISPNLTYFPYGFPPIATSAGKGYEFEIITENQDYVRLAESNLLRPGVLLGYQFSKEEVLKDGRSFFSFLAMKLYSWTLNSEFLFASLVFAIPFLYYYFWEGFKKRGDIILLSIARSSARYPFAKEVRMAVYKVYRVKKDGPMLRFIFLLGATIFLLGQVDNTVIILLLGLWAYVLKRYGYNSGSTFTIALTLTTATAILVVFGLMKTAERTAVWMFLFMTFAFLQALYETHKK